MTPESRQFLRFVADQPKGRVGYSIHMENEADALFGECLAKGYVKRRRPGFQEGFQITESGRAFLGGLD